MERQSNWWKIKSLLPFSAPSTILICGSMRSGKTYFTKQLLQNADGMFSIPVDKIVYPYSEYQPMLDEMMANIPRFLLHQGSPSKEDIERYTEDVNHEIVVLDDLMLQVAQSQDCVHLFTVTSHHRNVSMVMLS
jgi:Cdc6-like AAA superfamily ATPase